MEIREALDVFGNHSKWLLIIGLALFATTVLPRLLSKYPFSIPMALLILGYLVIILPINISAPDVHRHSTYIEYLTELGVIISLMGAGIKIDRPFSWKRWNVTWRLLGITMVITIGLSVFIGWWILAFAPATAMLLGAVIAPTDPVLASEVQVGAPGKGAKKVTEDDLDIAEEKEDELRFALTSEAGLNDGLAFPFTNMAIAMAIFGAHPEKWFRSWFSIHFVYELGIGIIMGLGMGYMLAKFLISSKAKSTLAKSVVGLGALAATLLIYGATEFFGGYGFLATFIGALVIRQYKPTHEFHLSMHIFIEKAEQIITALLMVGLGMAIGAGIFSKLTWPLVLCALLIVLVIRPLAGAIGLIGFNTSPWRDRLAIGFLGIRGIGSLYYLAYALNKQQFPQSDEIWALVALVIVLSIFIHGITGTPITQKLDELRNK